MNAAMRKLSGENGGKLPAFAWPGGYPLYYLDKSNSVLCPKCANEDGWEEFDHPVAVGTHWEGDPLSCEACDAEIASAYGDVEEDT